MGQFAVEWQVEMLKALVGLGSVYSLGWVWTNKECTARQMKRQEVCVSYNKIKNKLTVGLFRIIMQLFWPELAERMMQMLSRWTARDEAEIRTHSDCTFNFWPPKVYRPPRSTLLSHVCIWEFQKLPRNTAIPCDANPQIFREVNIFLSDYKVRQYTVAFPRDLR